MKLLHFTAMLSPTTPIICGWVLFNVFQDWQGVVNNALSDIKFISKAAARASESGWCKKYAWFARDVRDTVSDRGTPNELRGYGQFCVLKYAQRSASNKHRNADTWALFALTAYYGIDKFQKTPNLIGWHRYDESKRDDGHDELRRDD
ncbi:zincin [Curvularia clavata]|uniref:Zincin n=1 Tax=Curvularia clavata TaxID=95742 RepID=A0A9Q9DT45_CURCL|nr:zincin [Curvularia clavata]